MAERIEGPEREPHRAPAAGLPGLNGMVTLLTAIAVIAALYLARDILIPITLAILLSFVLGPVVHWLRILRLGRVPSVLLAALFGLILMAGIAGLIGTQIAGIASNVSLYYGTIENKIEAVQNATLAPITRFVNGLNFGHPQQPSKPKPPAPAAEPAQKPAPPPVPVVVQHPESEIEVARNVLTPVASPLATAFIVFIVAIFILLQREDLRDRMIRLFGAGDLHRTTVALDEAGRRLSHYYLAQLSVNAVYGCVIGIGLAVIGLPSPVLWGLMAALLRFVPYIGIPMAAILPVALAAAVEPGWSMVIATVVLYFGCEAITGQVIEPMLYGRSTGLSPAAVVIAAIFWTWIWGPIGLILSTPMTLCLVVLGRHVPRLEFLDVLLGDRPALTEVESFYQRLLAGDPDEAQELAEDSLKTRTLTEYYDRVALPGLQMAAADARKGALPADRVRQLRQAAEALVAELEEHSDVLPKDRAGKHAAPAPALVPGGAWNSEGAVLCVAGRGPFDGVAALILAQLLAKHGIGARVAGYAEVSREAIMDLPVRGVGMVCVTFLDLAGAPVHLRNLLRRLRMRLPTQPILVGFYQRGDAMLNAPHPEATVGAERLATSFHEVVAACIDAARHATPPGQHAAAADEPAYGEPIPPA